MKVLLILLSLILTGCGFGKQLRSSEVQEIKFGTGGGFTAELKAFTLAPDGRLFENDQLKKRIDSSKTTALYNEAIEFLDDSLRESGNMYAFIELRHKNNVNRITWAYGSTKASEKLIEFHKKLMALNR